MEGQTEFPDFAPTPVVEHVIAPAPAQRPGAWRRLADIARGMMHTRLDKSGVRLRLVAFGFTAVFLAIGGKLVYLGFKPDPQSLRRAASEAVSRARPDIVDRNGEVLATDVKVMSVFAEPRRIIDKDEAVELLTAVLPDVNARELRERLGSRKGFVWVKRGITPKEREEVFRLGLPGISFLPENKRIYPNGPDGAHVVGFTDIDNIGIAGIEKYIDGQGLGDLSQAGFRLDQTDLAPVKLSLDLRVTHAVRDEVAKGIERYKAQAGAGAIMDVNTGELIAYASLPDFDPNNPNDKQADARDLSRINRLNVGRYEMGSTFKAISIAMAMEAGKVNLNSRLDARESLRYGGFTIHDYHATHRMLTVPEVFTHSSNIGTARMAMMVGVDGHKAFLRKMGQLDRLRTELPESAEPLVPKRWSELNTITIAFGQGISVAPLQAMMAVAGLVNGGTLLPPTFLKRDEDAAKALGTRVVRPETSEALRYLMRINATEGSAKLANIRGYFVGGKTGTADKLIHGHYSSNRVFTTFMAIAPADKPRYLFMVLYDDPQGLPKDGGYHTAAYNSGVVTGAIIERVANLLDLPARLDPPAMPFPLLAKAGYTAANPPVRGN